MDDATLLDIPKLLTQPGFRRQALTKIDDPVTLEWWSRYENLSQGMQEQFSLPVLTRIRSLYRNRPMRNIVCRSDGVDWGRLLDQGSIILVSFAGTSIMAERDLLGELFISRIQLEMLSRLTRPTHK